MNSGIFFFRDIDEHKNRNVDSDNLGERIDERCNYIAEIIEKGFYFSVRYLHQLPRDLQIVPRCRYHPPRQIAVWVEAEL
jgi:hypothetical protein